MSRGSIRAVHVATFTVAAFAVVFQLVLVVQGHSPLVPELRPSTAEAVRRFFSFFTIQSNLLVAATTLPLVAGRGAQGRVWAVARLDAVVGITVTGVVHLVLLRPILHLAGVDWWADLLLHAVVPVLAVASWLVVGPRGRARPRDVWPALAWPVLWLVATLALGPAVRWYPYPFLDVATHGLAQVLLVCLVVAVLFVGLARGAVALDRRLPQRAAAES
ncbi:MAG: Pr6Pr family membrane protein [Cellulomonas sp.]|uniref:Pr6Pr family membrane protein n=1 Tax=Cellulomonas sp. 73-92 TaxID=1895740 RepID=UPI00092856D3|nr:Pr6Pr family membrane protein [Cellulomonas sp. 73-92]MBN9373985.1 Pr6Pr family membrane protein [Cellulomonas sp.]OJV80336.1 MAG: hypothetical protein BGO37_02905 [Cellulomonas sp. 73-92]